MNISQLAFEIQCYLSSEGGRILLSEVMQHLHCYVMQNFTKSFPKFKHKRLYIKAIEYGEKQKLFHRMNVGVLTFIILN